MNNTGFVKTKKRRWRVFVCTLGVLLAVGTDLRAPDPVDVSETGPIPRAYKSWSLFLVSNPEWLLDQKADQLQQLYRQFRAFGEAIGHDHVAVWFWSKEIREGKVQPSVDLMRCSAISKRLKLKLSEGPHVVVTTDYPGECLLSDPESFPERLTNYFVLKLNGTDSGRSARLLSKLATAVVDEKLPKLETQSSGFWQAWKRCFETIRDTLLDLTGDVKVEIKGGPVTVEMPLGPKTN